MGSGEIVQLGFLLTVVPGGWQWPSRPAALRSVKSGAVDSPDVPRGLKVPPG